MGEKFQNQKCGWKSCYWNQGSLAQKLLPLSIHTVWLAHQKGESNGQMMSQASVEAEVLEEIF